MKYLLLILLTSITLFASIGKVVALRGDANILREEAQIKIKLGSEVEKSDAIVTKANAKLQLIFNDKTIITIGPNSNFKIEEYIYEKKKNKAQFSMARGTFKTITGKIGKIAPNRFKIKTKSATIGIRGTQFLVNASSKNVQVFCTQGAVSVTDNILNKSVDVPAGFATEVNDGEAPKPAEKITAGSLKKLKAKLEPKKSKAKGKSNSKSSSNGQAIAKGDSEEGSEDTGDDEGTSDGEESGNDEGTSDGEEGGDDTGAADGSGETEGDGTTQGDDGLNAEEDSSANEGTDATAQEAAPRDSGESFGSNEPSSEVVVEFQSDAIEDPSLQNIPSVVEVTQVLSNIETISQDIEAKQVSDKTIEEKVKVDLKNLVTTIPDNAKIPETSPDAIHKDDTKLIINENPYLSWGYWVDSSNKKIDTYIDGIATSESIVQDHISNSFSASYSGDVLGLENGSRAVDGNFKMSVDFGQNHVGVDEFHVNNGTQNWDVTSSGSSTNMNSAGQFNVNVANTNNVDGVVKGQFYGSDAQAVGGTANLKSGTNTLDATFSGVR